MNRVSTSFYSVGFKLDASFYWPEANDDAVDKPLFIICSGFTGLKHIHPERFARALTGLGYPCFAFDYRGFHNSEGRRNWINLEEQAQDIVYAVSYLASHPDTAGRPVVLMGWGMGGGLILEASRLAPQVSGLVAVNGFYDAVRVQKTLRGEDEWQKFLEWLRQERELVAASGVMSNLDPFKIYPIDPLTEVYVNTHLRAEVGYQEGAMVTLNFADSLLKFAPEEHLDHLTDTPILIAHSDSNGTHPAAEAESLHSQYPGPKSLYWIPDTGHTDWMYDENPSLRNLISEINAWARQLHT